MLGQKSKDARRARLQNVLHDDYAASPPAAIYTDTDSAARQASMADEDRMLGLIDRERDGRSSAEQRRRMRDTLGLPEYLADDPVAAHRFYLRKYGQSPPAYPRYREPLVEHEEDVTRELQRYSREDLHDLVLAGQLTDKQRVALWLKGKGYSLAAVGHYMGVSKSTAQQHLEAGIGRLRRARRKAEAAPVRST